MTKQQFLTALRSKLAHLSQEELEERLFFYGEMIDDRIEEGLSEEEAVAAAGSIDDFSLPTQPKQKSRLRWWEITLLALGSPIWLSLLLAGVAVIFSLVISLWVCFLAVAASALACIVAGTILAFDSLRGFAFLGAGLVCAGLSIFLFYGSFLTTKYMWKLPKKLMKGRKHHA